MTFRTRVFLGSLAAATIPLGALGFLVSREGSRRLEQQYQVRVEDRVRDVAGLLQSAGRDLDRRLDAVVARSLEDDALRLDLVTGDASSDYVRGWAENAMALSGLEMLQLQDGDGVILSSGHFRGDFGRSQPDLPRVMETGGGEATLVRTATATGPRLMLARAQRLDVGSVPLWMVGGMDAGTVIPEVDDPPLSVTLRLVSDSGSTQTSAQGAPDNEVEALLPVPLFVDGVPANGSAAARTARLDTARVVIRHNLDAVRVLKRQTAMSLAVAVLLASLFAAALSRWMADRITAPLEELARRTTRVDLENLDVVFDTGRRDEVGRLSRFLDGMTERIRESAARVRSAERRAALGDVARQVNHDVKNAVAPIRNVVRHLDEVERSAPSDLAGVFRERLGTLQAGVDYLAELAGRYGKLGAPGSRISFDVGEVLATVGDGRQANTSVTVDRPAEPLYIMGDPLALRRIVENLVANAIDSLEGPEGRVRVHAEAHTIESAEGLTPAVRIQVADRGSGMDADTLGRAQQDFYTTKDEGTGLGLSIVRRLVSDLEGTMAIESAPGQGTTVTLLFPRSAR